MTNVVKCVIVGDAVVGKTSLAVKFTQDTFINEGTTSTIGVEFYTKTINKDGNIIKYHIWDTAGQEKFRSITTSYYRGASCILLCFSLNKRLTFEHIESYYDSATTISPENSLKILVGTFSDSLSDRQVSENEAIEKAKMLNIEYIEISSKTGKNIHELFNEIIPKYLPANKEINPKNNELKVKLNLHNKNSCC